MYEMEGASPAPPHQGSQSPGQLALRAARQGQAPVQKSGFPAFLTFRSFPRVVPVSGGECISTPSASAAQEVFGSYFSVILISTLCPQIAGSYPQGTVVIHDQFTAFPQDAVSNSRNIPISVHAYSRPRLQRGLRLSRNARIPSRASGSWLVAAITSTA